MKILNNCVLDGNSDEIKVKLNLAEEVVELIEPLIQEDGKEKRNSLKTLIKNYKEKNSFLENERNNLKKSILELKLKKRILVVLEGLDKLISSGKLNKENNEKMNILNFVKKIDKLPEEKINLFYNQIIKIVAKKMS